MPKILYTDHSFSTANLTIIYQANSILEEYEDQGYTLTLRQLYYQFVSRALLGNTNRAYKRLGSIINDGRLVDRTRSLRDLQHFNDASHALRSIAHWYHVDMWKNQRIRPEVWIEKDALVGVIEGICQEMDIPYFSCRGYASQSEMWRAGKRLKAQRDQGYETHIIHLGDHDPSGIDMSRDIFDRLELFMGGTGFHRIALNMDQVDQYKPPPNPAKLTDSRCQSYIKNYGNKSWELDALNPQTLTDLIRDAVEPMRDESIWDEDVIRKASTKKRLTDLSYNWEAVKEWMDTNHDE